MSHALEYVKSGCLARSVSNQLTVMFCHTAGRSGSGSTSECADATNTCTQIKTSLEAALLFEGFNNQLPIKRKFKCETWRLQTFHSEVMNGWKNKLNWSNPISDHQVKSKTIGINWIDLTDSDHKPDQWKNASAHTSKSNLINVNNNRNPWLFSLFYPVFNQFQCENFVNYRNHDGTSTASTYNSRAKHILNKNTIQFTVKTTRSYVEIFPWLNAFFTFTIYTLMHTKFVGVYSESQPTRPFSRASIHSRLLTCNDKTRLAFKLITLYRFTPARSTYNVHTHTFPRA